MKILPILAAALCARVACAQSPAAALRFETMAGANVARLPNTIYTNSRTGPTAGVGIIKPLGDGWAFQPELTYSTKGATGATYTQFLVARLSYLEVPLLLRYEVGSSAVRPFLHAGPAVALKVSCKFTAQIYIATTSPAPGLDQPGVALSEVARDSCGDGNGPKMLDAGMMVGGGFAFQVAGRFVSIGGRYDGSLTTIAKGSDAKNRVASVVATLEWPWHK